MNKNKKIYKKFYQKKIYFKDINIQQLKPNILFYLKKKYVSEKKNNHYILTNEGVFIFKNNSLKKYNYKTNIINETNDLVEINQYLKFNSDVNQIPYDHEYINILELSFNINDYFLTFEIVNDKINDFYIKTNNSLNILDILMIKEISYIKKLLI